MGFIVSNHTNKAEGMQSGGIVTIHCKYMCMYMAVKPTGKGHSESH